MAKIIVIDGLDGCGKHTQSNLLADYLKEKGKRVVNISFPNYESDSSSGVKMYLHGKFGDNPEEINPFFCSMLYAMDREIQYYSDFKRYYEEDDNTIIIMDRYLAANIIHQGGKIDDYKLRAEFIKWCYDLECTKCGLPIDDITIILSLKPEVSQKLLSKRYDGDTSLKDIHENNLEYLESCYNKLNESVDIANSLIVPATYTVDEDELNKLPKEKIDKIRNGVLNVADIRQPNWSIIDCGNKKNTDIRSVESIQKDIIKLVNKLLEIKD